MLGNRYLRIAAALFIGFAVVNLLWPRATGYVSTFAVVNAPVVTVRAPVNGTIQSSTPGVAAPVLADDILLDVAARFDSRVDLARLEGDVAARTAEADALAEEERILLGVADGLAQRAALEIEIERDFLVQKIAELRAIRRVYEVRWDRAEAARAQLLPLVEKGAKPRAALDAIEFDLAEADALLAEGDARIAAMEVELAAIEGGLPSPAGTGRRDFAYDRRDDILLAIADVRTRRLAAEGQRDGAARALALLQNEMEALGRFRPIAASDGVIWTASSAPGASVTLGADLFQVLDCERRFLEAVFNERAFEDLPAGTPATVQLRGSSEVFQARVISRHAAGGGGAQSAVDAAVIEPREEGGVKVFVALEPADVRAPGVAAAFCDVGRTAEVRIVDPRIAGFLGGFRTALADLSAPDGPVATRIADTVDAIALVPGHIDLALKNWRKIEAQRVKEARLVVPGPRPMVP